MMLVSSLVDLSSFNLINFPYVLLTSLAVLWGSLSVVNEQYLPSAIRQIFRYGKHAYKGPQDRLIALLEVPKAWFKHFYLFAALWSAIGVCFAVNTYFAGGSTPSYVIDFLDIVAANKRIVRTTPTETMVVLTLITIQCMRRFYETWFVQVFSNKLKMNISGYLMGYFHYFSTVATILSQAQGFVTPEDSVPAYHFELSPWIAFWSAVFIYACYSQFQSNLILANLRKDPGTGAVTNQRHSVPRGGYFELVSSPHMFFEIVMYVALYAIICRNTSAVYVLAWVFVNQILIAWWTHQWYRQNFKDYPRARRAVFPFVL